MKVEKLEKYYNLKADDGKYITSFQDGEDILNFTCFTTLFSATEPDISIYREITEEECSNYYALQIEKIKSME